MCHTTDNQSPRERLAQKIRTRTNEGDDILDYLFGVFYDKEPGVLHGHRIQAGRVLVIYGQLGPEAIKRLQELESHSGLGADRDQKKTDSSLARKIRRMTGDGDDILGYLLDTMNGIDRSSTKRIAHNNRLAAARELLKRGYPCECDRHDDAPDSTQTGTGDIHASASQNRQEHATEVTAEEFYDSKEEEADLQRVMDIIDRAIEETDPSEWEEDNPSGRKIDYSMWEIIDSLPEPEISEEHARVGAALFHEAVEKQRLWRESNVKIPTRNDNHNYDDG